MAKLPDELKESRTGPQVAGASVTRFAMFGGGSPLSKIPELTAQLIREMRTDPTIALVRSVFISPIAAGEWSIESDDGVPEDRIKFIKDQIVGRRQSIMEVGGYGSVDWGWVPWEKVYAFEGGRIVLHKLKPLLQDITTILIDPVTGAFAGFKQSNFGRNIIIPLEASLLSSHQVEGTNWYGRSFLENAKGAYADWLECDLGARRYDKKIAGTHLKIFFPEGDNELDDGTVEANWDIAIKIGKNFESNGVIILPAMPVDTPQWQVDILEDKGNKQASFVNRLVYKDVQKARAFTVPERTALEGEHGTKAEAGEHGDIAIINMELLDQTITKNINWHLVDQLLALNWGDGARGTVRLVSAPLDDDKKKIILDVYKAILADPSGFMEEFGNLDTDAMKDLLKLPKSKQVARVGSVRLPGLDVNDPRNDIGKEVFAGRGRP